MKKYTGAYDFGGGFALKIFIKGNKIFGLATGWPVAELFPESEKRFFLKVVDASVDFEFNNAGEITGLTLHQGREYRVRKTK